MNTTVAVVLPEWLVWFLGVWFVLHNLNHALDLYKKHLESKLNRK